ncbi:DUF7123 family protein [Halomicrococcus sp. NG-SE-24]|uniref:DUF7123 family protein n=1 Tax=Halomicrococcus sp. NG-SE-24 TaxID=3436928 RepID=UPI003D997396
MSDITRQAVREYIVTTADAEPTYLRAREIASELDSSPKAVAQYLRQLQDELGEVSIEQWGRSKSTTWRIKKARA